MSILRYAFKEARKDLKKEASGSRGELAVKNIVDTLPYTKCIHNIVIKDSKGFTYQIDHIVISKNGLFVIETKNYRGKIIGNEKARAWQQVLSSDIHDFLNPLIQNESHVNKVEELLNDKYRFSSLIVFAQNNVTNLNITNVINIRALSSFIQNNNQDKTYDDEERNQIYQTLKEKLMNQPSLEEHEYNVSLIRNKIAHGICPVCGSKLMWKIIDKKKKAVCSNENCQYEVKPY